MTRELDKTLNEGIDLYAELVQRNVEVLKIIEEDGSQWKVLQKQLLQNQEDVKRLFRELDGKAQSLKLTAAEVISIKRKIRLVKRENLALREELERAAEFEPQVFVNRPDLMAMDDEEVRNKVLSLAKVAPAEQAYRDERVRNKNLMKTLKLAQKDIADRTKVLASLKKLEDAIAETSAALALLSNEFSKAGLYRDTINKNESMILRLEAILKTVARDTRGVRGDLNFFTKELNENLKLKNNIEAYAAPDNHGEHARFKQEVARLELDISRLQAELASARPQSMYKQKQVGELAGKEVHLDRVNARVEALERQGSLNSAAYAQQIVVLKTKIAEKDAMLKAISKEL